MAKLDWERVESTAVDVNTPYTIRAKVPGGWLVCVVDNGSGLTFLPDPEHQWGVNKPEAKPSTIPPRRYD